MIDVKIWIISDTHWGHAAISRLCSRPDNVDELMLGNWVSTVHPNDTVLHLGDILTWRGKENPGNWMNVLSKLPGKKLFVRGNHERYVPKNWKEIGDVLGQFVEQDVTRDGTPYTNNITNHGFYHNSGGRRILFSHYPDACLLDWDINIHGHIHNNPYSPKIDKERDYRNVSVEVMDYKPVQLSEVLNG